MNSWTWAAASCRGTSHIKRNVRRQDAYSCSYGTTDGQTLIAIVSDGAGSAVMGGEGASLICRTLMTRARQFDFSQEELPTDETLWEWINAARQRIKQAAEARDLHARDFAATVIMAISSGANTLVAHCGDGSAVVRYEETDEWTALSWPSQGQYASSTFFVTDNPEPKLNISRCDTRVSALAVFSDGIERLALDMAAQKPFKPFFDGMIRPIASTEAQGCDQNLSMQLSRYLSGDAVNARTDDDKTLILAVRNQ
ncbi:MAG TPA: PP2C family serine/threonine-protein phosphatase [Oculatellaceae cyanobacterium]